MARVLVIDHNDELCELVQMLLTLEGHITEGALDGLTGMAAQRRGLFDLVICDLFMPDQDGLDTIAQLRREFPGLKVIAVSGGGKVSQPGSYLRTASTIGADAVLSKPFEGEELVRTVRVLLA